MVLRARDRIQDLVIMVLVAVQDLVHVRVITDHPVVQLVQVTMDRVLRDQQQDLAITVLRQTLRLRDQATMDLAVHHVLQQGLVTTDHLAAVARDLVIVDHLPALRLLDLATVDHPALQDLAIADQVAAVVRDQVTVDLAAVALHPDQAATAVDHLALQEVHLTAQEEVLAAVLPVVAVAEVVVAVDK